MKVKDVMTSDVITVGPDATYKDVVETLARHHISGVPVVDADGTMLGLITEADLLPKEARTTQERKPMIGLLAEALLGRLPAWVVKADAADARALMTADVITVGPDENLHVAARRMIDNSVKRLPVVEDGRLLGILSRADVLGVFARDDAAVRQSVQDLLSWCMYEPPEHDIHVAVHDGIVTLSGMVLRESDVRVVGSIVRGGDGVVGVDNQLKFAERDPKRPTLRGPEGYGAH